MKLPTLLWLAVTVIAVTVSRVPASYGEEHIVEIRGFGFVPDKIFIQPGDTVTWVNRDIVSHTATALDQSWDTGEIMPDENKTLVFSARFSHPYSCTFHPGMRGAL